MKTKIFQVRCDVDPIVRICCLNADCVNQDFKQHVCNLKNLIIDPLGKCSGFIKIKKPKTKTDKK